MVVGGRNDYGDVELIDLTGQGRSCQKPENYPGASYGSVGTFYRGSAIVCGGNPYTSTCYLYS